MFTQVKNLFLKLLGKDPDDSDNYKVPKNLSRKEQKQIREIIEKARGDDGVPRTAQQSIPFQRMFPDGICPGEDTMFVLSCVMKGARWTTLRDVGYVYYRMDGTTLSRYLGNYENTLRYWKEKWDEYLGTVGKGYDGWWPTRDYSAEWVAAQQWENMWRRGSPISLRVKWDYLNKHHELATKGRLSTLGIKVVKTFIRLHFYIRPIRRWHLKRCLPRIKDERMTE